MADNNFRSYRGRETGAPSGAQQDDPLAELARLIGQSEPAGDAARDLGRDGRPSPERSFDESALDWPAQESDAARYPADDRYAAQAGAADYEAAYDDRYEAVPEEDFQSYRPGLPDDRGASEVQGGRRASALATRLNGARDFARDYVPPEQPGYREVAETRAVAERQPLPALQPQPRVERYQFDEDAADDQAYDEYQEDEEIPAGRRRSGFFVVAAVLGLAVVGTAGAFAYRAMFGSSVLPTLPPIIKADDGPTKIIPAKPKSSSDQADARNTGSGEKLVSREEQPVDMPAPVNPTPRMVSTIPIFPDPNSGQAGVPNSVQPGMQSNMQPGAAANATAAPSAPNGSLTPAPMPPPVAASAPPAAANSIWPPVPAPAAAIPAPAAPAPAAAAMSTSPHKVHTVVIHSDQLASQGAAATPEAAGTPPTPQSAPAEPAPVRTAPVRAAAPPARPMPAARVDANAPLSIVPGQSGEAPPAAAPRLRTAPARVAEAPAAPREEASGGAGGGYAVQVTSQRSEAGAQAEFRALKAKFPTQLGGREPLIRRADLGAKGVYYRALVGPFASAEQATALCSGLKSAGGTCIVQRN